MAAADADATVRAANGSVTTAPGEVSALAGAASARTVFAVDRVVVCGFGADTASRPPLPTAPIDATVAVAPNAVAAALCPAPPINIAKRRVPSSPPVCANQLASGVGRTDATALRTLVRAR